MLRNDNAHSAHHDVSLMTRHRPKRWRPVGEQGTGVSSWQSWAEDPRDCSAWKTTDGAKGMCHQTLARLVKNVVLCHYVVKRSSIAIWEAVLDLNTQAVA